MRFALAHLRWKFIQPGSRRRCLKAIVIVGYIWCQSLTQSPWGSFRIQGQPLLHKFFQDQPILSSFNGIDGPMASLYDLQSRKFHFIIYQSVTIHGYSSMVHAVGPKALYFLIVQSNRSFKQKERDEPWNQYFSWLIKCQMASCHYPKLPSSWIKQKIGWGCMNRHIL